MASKFASASLIGKSGAAVAPDALAGKVVGIYFSAHWCPPCRGFTPQLAAKYTELKAAGQPFEVVFVSSDRDAAACQSYYAEMPWLLLDFKERALKDALASEYGVRGIPCLVLVDASGKLLTTEGRSVIMSTPFERLATGGAANAAVRAAAPASALLMRHFLAIVVALAVLSSAPALLAEHAPAFGRGCASNKPYRDFNAFYPFYLSQHADEMCRRLHFVGTSLVLLLSTLDIGVVAAFLCASAVGVVACALTCTLPHGIVEALCMVTTFALVYPYLSVSSKHRARLAWLMPLVGYGFAWVGHYFFEKNKPATFVYPAFSLFGDFKMWFEIATGARAF